MSASPNHSHVVFVQNGPCIFANSLEEAKGHVHDLLHRSGRIPVAFICEIIAMARRCEIVIEDRKTGEKAPAQR